MRFLKCICTLCRAARHKGLLQGLDVFCHGFELAKSIKVRGHAEGLGKGSGSPVTGTLRGQHLGRIKHAWTPQGDLGAAEKPCQRRPQHQGWQGPHWVCWHWVLVAARTLIPTVLCRHFWKRSPGTTCARLCGSSPWMPSPP